MDTIVEYSPAMLFAALLALLLEWFPKLKTWWESLSAAKKTTLNALGVAVISILAMMIPCWRGGECPADPLDAAWKFLLTALLALAANQATYQAVKKENFE